MMRKGTLVLVGVAALATAGCQSLGRAIFDEPVVNFRDLRVRGLGATGGALDVQLSIYNPNNYALDAKRFTYRLMVDSTQIATGQLEQLFTVRSGDSTVVTIPVNFNYLGLGRAGQQILNRGTLDYRVLGDFTVGTPIGDFTRPYDQRGTFSAFSGSNR